MAKRNHESILGLGPNPLPREIRLAYLRASLKAHPDHGGSNAEMAAVNEAWENLRVDQSADDVSEHGSTAEEDGDCSWETECLSDDGSEYHMGDQDFDSNTYYDYGDLDETGGMYKVQLDDGIEVSLEEHERCCGCGCKNMHVLENTPGDSDVDGSLDVDISDSE